MAQHTQEGQRIRGSASSGIYSRDAISKTGVTHHYFGADPFYIQLYSELHARYDPLAIFPPKGRVTAIPELVSYEEYRRGPFYREWLRPQGFADAVNVVLANRGVTRATLLTVLPGKSQMVDLEMRHRVELIPLHLQRAILIYGRLDEKQEELAGLSETLDGLETAIFLVNAEGRVVHVNNAGKSMLRSARIFRLNGGRLAGSDAAAEQTLRDLLATDVEGCEAHANVLANRGEGGHHYVIQRLKLGLLSRSRVEGCRGRSRAKDRGRPRIGGRTDRHCVRPNADGAACLPRHRRTRWNSPRRRSLSASRRPPSRPIFIASSRKPAQTGRSISPNSRPDFLTPLI